MGRPGMETAQMTNLATSIQELSAIELDDIFGGGSLGEAILLGAGAGAFVGGLAGNAPGAAVGALVGAATGAALYYLP